jgi:transcriptional regulator of acetoin/glycerol metabolism
MGTPTGYARRVSRSKWAPPDRKVAARIEAMVKLFQRQQEIEAEYKRALAALADPEGDNVPISHLAERLGIERKTVYRHLGRSMT